MLVRLLVDVAPVPVRPRRLRGWTRDLQLAPRVQDLQGSDHCVGEHISVVLAAEVEPVHLLVVAPLVESWCCLVVLQTLENGTVDHHLVVLEFPSDHSECVVDEVVVDVDLGEAMTRSSRDPFLVEVVVDHHRGTSCSYALLWALVTHLAGDSEGSLLKEVTLAYIIPPVGVHSCPSLSCFARVLFPSLPRIDPPMNYQVTRGFRFPSIIKPKDHQQRQQGQDKYKPLTAVSQLVRLFTSPISRTPYKFTPHMAEAALGPRPVCLLDMIDSANFLSSSTGG